MNLWTRVRRARQYNPDAQVALDRIGPYYISTVWTGDAEECAYETMVFTEDPRLPRYGCQWYSTEEEARRGHRAMVKEIRWAKTA